MERKMMGLMDFPYHACKSVTQKKGIYSVNKGDTRNPFECERLENNLTGTEAYCCFHLWVYKDRSDILVDLYLFVYVYYG